MKLESEKVKTLKEHILENPTLELFYALPTGLDDYEHGWKQGRIQSIEITRIADYSDQIYSESQSEELQEQITYDYYESNEYLSGLSEREFEKFVEDKAEKEYGSKKYIFILFCLN